MQQKSLVLFDFDGTLTRRDSLLVFLWFAVPGWRLLAGVFKLAFNYLGMIWSGGWSNGKAKEQLFSVFFKGRSQATLEHLGSTFHQQHLPKICRTEMLAILRAHKKNQAAVFLVSASASVWLTPFCQSEDIGLICTELAFEAGVFTGKFATPNCNGHEKARRIRAEIDLSLYEKIIAYGNSAGDAEMLALANEAWMLRGNNLVNVS